MPLFVFMSGYLLNTPQIQKMSLSSLFIKYWNRMIKQWLLALVVYSFIISFPQDTTTSILIIERICKPFYHLWYIPVLFVMILTIWLIGIIVKDKKQRVLIYVFLGLALCGLYNFKYDLLSYYRLHFFIFFFLGILSKEYQNMYYSQKSTRLIMTCCGLSIITLLFIIGVTYKDFRIYFMTPFCSALCIWIMLPTILTDSFKSKSLGLIGRHSLEIYLWHVIPILILKRLINDIILYYSISFLLLGLVLIVLTHIPIHQPQS